MRRLEVVAAVWAASCARLAGGRLLQQLAGGRLLQQAGQGGAASRAALLENVDAGELRRPIVTGCLLECGVQDQSCVTQCQVCVEAQKCQTLKSDGCEMCRREVSAATFARAKAPDVYVDSGGVPLAYEGVEQRLEQARFRLHDENRLARQARDSVLVAQRQVEWADEEWRDQSRKLEDAKARLQEVQNEYARSKMAHTKKIRQLKKEIREAHERRERLEEELSKTSERRRHEEVLGSKDVDSGGAVGEADAREWAYQRHLGTQTRMEEHLRRKLSYEEEHAKFLDQGLTKDVKEAELGVEEAVGRLRHARAVARLASDNLKGAKDGYRSAQAMTYRAKKVVEHLEGTLKDRLSPLLPHPAMSYEGGPNQTVPEQDRLPATAGSDEGSANHTQLDVQDEERDYA